MSIVRRWKNGCRLSVDGRMDADCQSMEERTSIVTGVRRLDVDRHWSVKSGCRVSENGCQVTGVRRMDVGCPSTGEWMLIVRRWKNGCQLSVDGRMDVGCPSMVRMDADCPSMEEWTSIVTGVRRTDVDCQSMVRMDVNSLIDKHEERSAVSRRENGCQTPQL